MSDDPNEEMDYKKYDHFIKILVIGDSEVGKTSFIKRFLSNEYSDKPINTKDLELKNKLLEIDNQKIYFNLWDGLINSKQKKTTKTELSVRVQGIAIIYDVSNYASFNSLEFYIKEVKETCGSDMPIIIIGNKIDLERIVDQEEAENFAKDNNVEYIETSVLNNENIEKSIVKLSEKIINCSYFKGDTITLNKPNKFKKAKKIKKKNFC